MRSTIYIAVICAAVGCRSQSTPLTNPFLAPDRVPPPATRTPAPGTAQPYYPTDVAPLGTAAPAVVPGATFAPASTATPTYTTPTAPLQTAPVTPPGGWGQPATTTTPYGSPTTSYNPLQSVPSDSVAVRINSDDQSLRFAGAPNNQSNGILQASATQPSAAAAAYIYTPPMAATLQGAIQPAQFATASVSGAASDGFRPQGSSQQKESTSVTRPQELQISNASTEDSARFGFDPTYSWLRGQLQYYPETGYWGIRYITLRGSPDTYGGVAIISNPEVLAGVQPGEYLLLQGSLETQDNFDGTFLPLYTVEGIQRQR